MNRKAIIDLAMEAANDYEWGYFSSDALDHLREVDPDYDWEAELLQAELEAGHRTMGPSLPPRPDPMADYLRSIYEPLLVQLVEQDATFIKLLKGPRPLEDLSSSHFASQNRNPAL
jgi:hypothetical protein